MDSENPIGADNQQETRLGALDPGWVVGFVDGEGCFSVSIHHNELARPTRGWHVQPTFQVSQHTDHRDVLEGLRTFFACGNVRSKGPASSVDVYTVHSTIQLEERVLPFFEENALESEAVRLRAVRLHREGDSSQKSPSTRGLRRYRPPCLLDECEGPAAVEIYRGNPPGILRDCTQGTTLTW